MITGKHSSKSAEAVKQWYLDQEYPDRVLVGTATLATGVDGIDKVCDQLLIFDRLDGDPSKERQLIGRVLPRGTTDRPTHVVFATTE